MSFVSLLLFVFDLLIFLLDTNYSILPCFNICLLLLNLFLKSFNFFPQLLI